MTNISEIRHANVKSLSSVPFLVNLALLYDVTSIPLALVYFILTIIGAILFIFLTLCILRTVLRRLLMNKKHRKPLRGIYLDEVPGAEGENLGRCSLEYTVECNFLTDEFIVGIVQGNNLVNKAGSTLVDAYATVDVYRSEDRNKPIAMRERTRPLKRQQRHCWQELYSYTMPSDDVKNLFIVFQIFDNESPGQQYCLGRLEVVMSEISEVEYAGEIAELLGWVNLDGVQQESPGELCIGLCYDDLRLELTVIIYEARYLKSGRQGGQNRGKIDVLVEIMKGKKQLSTKKTKIRSEASNPYFNQSMVFMIKADSIGATNLVCIIRGRNRIGIRYRIGYVQLGVTASISGRDHWRAIIKCPRTLHVSWHPVSKKKLKPIRKAS